MLFRLREEGHRYLRAQHVSITVPGTGERVVNQRTGAKCRELTVSRAPGS